LSLLLRKTYPTLKLLMVKTLTLDIQLFGMMCMTQSVIGMIDAVQALLFQEMLTFMSMDAQNIGMIRDVEMCT